MIIPVEYRTYPVPLKWGRFKGLSVFFLILLPGAHVRPKVHLPTYPGSNHSHRLLPHKHCVPFGEYQLIPGLLVQYLTNQSIPFKIMTCSHCLERIQTIWQVWVPMYCKYDFVAPSIREPFTQMSSCCGKPDKPISCLIKPWFISLVLRPNYRDPSHCFI